MNVGKSAAVIAVLCATMFGAVAAPVQKNSKGRICLAPLPTPAKGQGAPWRVVGTDSRTNYVVQVDQQQPVPLSLSSTAWISGLVLSDKHSVIIRADEQVLQSFDVHFDRVAFGNPARPDLCLFVNDLYLTWQLWPVEKTGDWCPCWQNEQPN